MGAAAKCNCCREPMPAGMGRGNCPACAAVRNATRDATLTGMAEASTLGRDARAAVVAHYARRAADQLPLFDPD